MNIVYTKKDYNRLPPFVIRSAPQGCGIEGQKMQRCSKACRLLLITPALFILLQVAHALHQHNFETYHDDGNLLHSLPTAFYHDHIKQDPLICFASEVLLFPSSCLRIRNTDSPNALITALITEPSQSRAPPSTSFSRRCGTAG